MKPYPYLFDVDDDTLNDLCYFFEFRYADGRDPRSYAQPLVDFWQEWMRHRVPGTLVFQRLPDGGLRIVDSRFNRRVAQRILNPFEAAVYDLLDEPRSLRLVQRRLAERFPELAADTPALERLIADLDAELLVLREGNQALALAIPTDLQADLTRPLFPKPPDRGDHEQHL